MIGKLCYINAAKIPLFSSRDWASLNLNDVVLVLEASPQFDDEVRVLSSHHGTGFVWKKHLNEL